MSNYWQDREANALAKITNRSITETEKLLAKSYAKTSRKIVEEFADTYEKLFNTVADGREPTPADLYKLDKYWKMSIEVNNELKKLGIYQEQILSKKFVDEFAEIYGAISFNDIKAFSTIDREGMVKAINSIWCADGKTWSNRIWDNIGYLQETLQEELIHCVTTGKKTTDLKNILQERFNVSFSQADMLVRTEMAHIQNSAAQQRYKDYGIEEVQVWADKDERRCEVCGKLHQKKFPINAALPIPAHPRCRCSIIPVVE